MGGGRCSIPGGPGYDGGFGPNYKVGAVKACKDEYRIKKEPPTPGPGCVEGIGGGM